ncbi:MAG TPA: PEP/pyruvate-binding domain-containing protein [Longimicrobium sp.]|nr:PEP/pyruvate-binding domain-containing protein [Longimicrobium sp.]
MILEFTDPAAVEASVSGGKGASLARLTQGGFAVPPGVIVPAAAYRAFLASVPGVDALVAALRPEDAVDLHARCAEIRRLLVAAPLPAELDATLRARLPALLAEDRVSVRSSATLEDLAGAAFAGQHDTYLNVAGVEGVLDAVRRCWASLWEDRAVRYRHERGFGVGDAAMAVVVQRMVRSEVAGVAFSMDPVSGDLDRIVINAAYGLGETVVSGEGGIDQYAVSKRTGEVLQREIGEKTQALLSTGQGTERVAVEPEKAAAPALADPDLAALRDLVIRVERFYAFPQDTEWALAGGELYLLQSRPVTEFPARWTRDESAERFPNPITPLTWDFTSEGFHESLAYSLELLGYPPFAGKWFDRFDGYIYGNQTAVQLFTQGLQVRVESIDELLARKDEWIERYRWVQELPVTWARDLDRYLLTLGRLSAVGLSRLDDAALWRHLLAVDALGRDYFRPNIAISITQGVLHRTLFGVVAMIAGREQAPALYDALTCFCETKTNLVNTDLHRLYRAIRGEPGLERLLVDSDRRALWEDGTLDRFPRFASAFGRFLENHGHREVDFDAYVPTWIGQPWVVLENLRLMLLQGDVADPAEREVELRARQSAAERDYLAAVPDGLRNFAAEMLRLTRAYTGLDDLEHYQTTRLSIPFRAAIVEVGRRLAARGVIDSADDVFFLRKHTLVALMEGGAADGAADEARRNRAEYDGAKERTPPRVYGEEPEAPVDGALRGLPGSPGVAEGPVCRVHGVEDFARFTPGSVLVARTTNPAWTPLFYSAVAVVTESGGPLSHGAVTAREVGVPAVMAVHGALTSLRDGERVRVNGSQGVVARVE